MLCAMTTVGGGRGRNRIVCTRNGKTPDKKRKTKKHHRRSHFIVQKNEPRVPNRLGVHRCVLLDLQRYRMEEKKKKIRITETTYLRPSGFGK